MGWAINGTPDTLTVAGDVLQITDLTAKKFNTFLIHQLASGGIDNIVWTFNNNTNSVYAFRTSKNGLTDTTSISQAGILVNLGDGAWDRFYVVYGVSISSEEKLLIGLGVGGNTAGAGNAPDRIDAIGKFIPSPDADITRIDDTNGGSGDYAISSNLSALGTD